MILENKRLFRKPPLLGPPLSLPDFVIIVTIINYVYHYVIECNVVDRAHGAASHHHYHGPGMTYYLGRYM